MIRALTNKISISNEVIFIATFAPYLILYLLQLFLTSPSSHRYTLCLHSPHCHFEGGLVHSALGHLM